MRWRLIQQGRERLIPVGGIKHNRNRHKERDVDGGNNYIALFVGDIVLTPLRRAHLLLPPPHGLLRLRRTQISCRKSIHVLPPPRGCRESYYGMGESNLCLRRGVELIWPRVEVSDSIVG